MGSIGGQVALGREAALDTAGSRIGWEVELGRKVASGREAALGGQQH
jgi:hypothetical protein